MSKSIGPHDALAPGTQVQVKNERGHVLGHTTYSNMVVVHKIRITKRMHKNGNKTTWRDREPVVIEPNYSFVVVL